MYITMYARALNGKIKVWRAEEAADGINIYHGYFNGEMIAQTVRRTMSTVNKQFFSMVKKKKQEGYKDINDILLISKGFEPSIITEEWLQAYLPATNLDDNYNLKPMKCQKFKKGKMKYPAIAQPKYNGLRSTLRWESYNEGEGLFKSSSERAVLRSQSGLEYHLPHITNMFTKDMFFDKKTNIQIAYDGEIYVHNTPINIINSATPIINENGVISQSSNAHITSYLYFMCFDLPLEDVPQLLRYQFVTTIPPYRVFRISERKIVFSDEEVEAYTTECIAKGYEGCVVRNMDAEYVFGGRPMTIMKSKKFQDGEFELLDISAKNGDSLTDGSDIQFIMRNDINNNTFECTPMYSMPERITMMRNKHLYIGKMFTVKYYERSGIKQVPFHANVVTQRDYE